MQKTHLGLHVGEKAMVRNLIATIERVSDGCSTLKPGDRIHLPHHRVQDVEIEGKEYAIAKEKDIAAVCLGDGFSPINGYVHVRKCVNDHVRDENGEISLYMTEKHIEWTHWVEVLAVAADCKKMKAEHIGLFTVSPESDDRLCRMLYTEDFMIHEDLVHFLTEGD